MTEYERDKMRRDDHDAIIRIESCLKGVVREQREQGEQIKDLYEKMSPVTQWIGTANVGFRLFSLLGIVVVVVSLLWNTVATGTRAIITEMISSGQDRGEAVVIDPDAPEPEQSVRRLEPADRR